MTIVVGAIATPEGRAALRHAGAEAVLRGLDLVVVETSSLRDADHVELSRLTEARDGVRADLSAAGLQLVARPAADGDDHADALIGAAEETGAELLVVGLRRRTPVGKLILGSNAQRVLLEAPCAVLAVKADVG